MRIAILAPLVTPIAEPQLGGSQVLVADLAAGLASRGHDVDVFASLGSTIAGVNVVDTGVESSTLREALLRPGGRARPDLTRPAFVRAWDMIAGGGHDVVHNHAFDAPAIELAPAGMRVVHTLHLPPAVEIAAALDVRPAVVACVSEHQARAWRALTRVDAVLRNGVPVARIGWSASGGDEALFAGRFSPEKGAAEAIEIARRAGVPIVLYGSAYDEAYAASLRGARIERPLQRAELWTRMAAARALVCPARWDEPFGLTAAEAQACGTPVVGFRRGGLAEVVGDGVTGALVDDGDLDAAAAALAAAGGFDRTACRRHAERTLDLESTLDAHERLYERVADGAMTPKGTAGFGEGRSGGRPAALPPIFNGP